MFFSKPKKDSQEQPSDPDALLMVEFQQGKTVAFETLMRKYYGRVLNFIYRFVGNRAVAEELTQDVFLRVHQGRRTYQPQAKFQTWIYTIAKNVALNELRSRKGTVSLDEVIVTKEGEVKRDLADQSAVNPQEELFRRERQALVAQAIASLPENQRMAVILRRYDDFSYEEIAATLGCSVAAVKSLLSRAKENLRDKLADLVEAASEL